MHGPFQVVKTLYATGYVTVFVSADAEGNEIVVKAVHLSAREPDIQRQVQKLESAMPALRALSHPNLVQHIQSFQRKDNYPDLASYYLTMEYCNGGSLSEFVRGQAIGDHQLDRWMREILEALAYLHRNSLVHRDLKGANILLSTPHFETCGLKICDLGDIHQLMGSVTGRDEVSDSHGTIAYMSPEMIAGPFGAEKFQIGRKTDIWSYGCVVIEMLSRQQPQFIVRLDGRDYPLTNGSKKILVFVGRDGGRPELSVAWPLKLYNLIDNCLIRDPQKRPSAQELLESQFS
ncbi:putative Serine/threonine-protein kinase max-2 [Hypsibius exemplaris]|uniref:Serine/threonine-protein kinase max-2 n=1 Tax=Hypsibius exemplaris TaxID=2072580 RepID=A0A1W0WZP7_HYPEX|nr:putative Serine/threonine-protein kinase max-2 [Hypsibius exemplaris]